jgi:lactoylglutathione lyase
MHIHHIAIYTNNLEKLKSFYTKYFNGTAGEKYVNSAKEFQSYFVTFQKGPSLEIMQKERITTLTGEKGLESYGITHLAFSVGGTKQVDELTETLRGDGYIVASEPRTTGDGFYESVLLDPDGNRIEITE